MNQIKTEIIINAPIEHVWKTLLDFQAYPQWNPFIKKIDGSPTSGTNLVVTIQPPGQKPMKFRPQILTISDYHFSWIGSLGIKTLFAGEHNFKLEDEASNQTRLRHFERFSGILHKPILAMIGKSTQNGFNSMNLALKDLCEKTHINSTINLN